MILCLSPCHIIFVSRILLSCDAYNNSFCVEILECERSPEVLILNEVVWIRLPFVLRFHMILCLCPCHIIFASHILLRCDAYNNLFCAKIFECEIFCEVVKFQLPIFFKFRILNRYISKVRVYLRVSALFWISEGRFNTFCYIIMLPFLYS